MAISKIDAIYLYTDMTWEEGEKTDSTQARAYLDAEGVEYILLNYADPAQHEDATSPLRTWGFIDGYHDIKAFPFVIYTEVHDDMSMTKWPKVLLYGLDAIIESNISDLYKLGR
jgi:hypothetical protein